MAKQLISARQMARVRRVNEQFMPDSATVLRRTLSDDGRGGKLATYAETGTIRCRVSYSPMDSKDREVGGRIKPVQRIFVSFAIDADVLETDRLTIKGVTYDITSTLKDRSFAAGKKVEVVPV